MGKINFFSVVVLIMMLFSVQLSFAGDFTPEAGELYSIRIKGADLLIGPNPTSTKKVASLQPILQSSHESYSLAFEEQTGGGFHLRNQLGDYLFYSGWEMTFTAYNPNISGDKGYLFDFIADADNPGYYRISVVNKNSYVAPDNVGSGSGVYSNKGATHANGLFEIIKSSTLDYSAKVEYDAEKVQIEAGKGGTPDTGKGSVMITVYNYSGMLDISIDDGFSVSETSVNVTDGESFALIVTSDATKPLGSTGTLTISQSGTAISSVPVEVINPLPRYYIINVETGFVVGGNGDAVLVERADNEEQYFKKVAVAGTTDTYYLIQESSGNYFKRVDAGEGVATFYTEFGLPNKAEWKFPANGAFSGLKNTTADRILMGSTLGAKLLLYGLNSDAGTKWELIEVDNLSAGTPWVDVLDENILVEKNGLTFATQVRALNLNGKSIEIRASQGVNVSVSSIQEGFVYTDLLISSSADPGTACKIEFLLDGAVMKTINFTVQSKFERYIIKAVQPEPEPDPETGEVPEIIDLAIGANEDEPLLPRLKELDVKDPSQYFLIVPITATTSYIIQDGTFNYFAKYESDHWQTTLDKSTQRIWEIDRTDPENVIIRNTFNNRSLGVNKYQAGERIATDRGDTGWILEALGSMEIDINEIVLANKNDSKKITVTAANLKDEITVTASEGFTVDKTTLPAVGGEITISAEDGSVLSGTVVLKSGIYEETIHVRMKNTQLSVSEESLQMTGKGASASFLVQGSDWETAITITVSEGFSVNVSSIEPAASINQSITVSYAGQVSANGTVTVESGSFKKEIPVTATIDSKITVSAKELELDEGFAVFTVTAKDLFEDIIITSSSTEISVDPGTLDANVVEGFVFVQYNGTGEAPGVNITLTSGNITETVKVNGGSTGIGDTVGDAIQISVKGDQLYVNGLPAGAKVMVTDILGKSVIADSLPYTISNQGVYIISILDGQKSIKTQKVVR